MDEINLPAITNSTASVLQALTDSLEVPRDILASDEEIKVAWTNLPRILKRIPPQQRSAGLARMCVAVVAGLFDSAINYAWNSAIIELREKVKRFGLNVVRQVVSKPDFDETALLDLKDSELLELCLKLNLITEEGYFFLDQCRDIRNNFSAAHPAVGTLDDSEFIAFLSRCSKYALGDDTNPVGVDIHEFILSLKSAKYNQQQKGQWVERLRGTHEAQRELLFVTLHGIYSDPASSEEARLNALSVVGEFISDLSPKAQSELIDQHQDYIARGIEDRHRASQQFFEQLGLLSLLSESERHSLISNACKKLIGVHQALDNFYNEPPFAERLAQITGQGAVPDTVKAELVETVLTCAVGNPYGVSNAAYPHYARVIEAFTPREIDIMLALPRSNTIVGNRIRTHSRCKSAFRELVKLIDSTSIPTKSKITYQRWTGRIRKIPPRRRS